MINNPDKNFYFLNISQRKDFLNLKLKTLKITLKLIDVLNISEKTEEEDYSIFGLMMLNRFIWILSRCLVNFLLDGLTIVDH